MKKGDQKRAAKKELDMYTYIFMLFETNRMIVFGERKKEIKRVNRKNKR